MTLTKYKFGDFIVQRREKYDGHEELPSWGVSREGFITPKQDEADTSIYNVFYLNDFVFNPARMELNSIALNTRFEKAICSSLYEVFYISRPDIVLPEYLNLFIKRDEFARKCWFEAIGSARNYFRVSNLGEFEIELPSIPVQQKYVDVYKAMVDNQQAYENGLSDLKLTCEAYIEDLRRKMPCEKIGQYIEERDETNSNGKYKNIIGISKDGFVSPRQERSESTLTKCKLVNYHDFVFSPSRVNIGSISFSINSDTHICSEEYEVFHIKNESQIIPEYLLMWLKRDECGRFMRFITMDSVRNRVYIEDLAEVCIPIPDISVQKSIVDIYRCFISRKENNEHLKAIIKDLCPVLIRGSIEEARKEI